MLDKANDQHRLKFFERKRNLSTGRDEWTIKQEITGSSRGGSSQQQTGQPQVTAKREPVIPSSDPIASLTQVIRAETHRKKKYPPSETGNSPRNYEQFIDLIHKMLSFDPQVRIKPDEALKHPFLNSGDHNPNESRQV
jgi:serine/threonine protein kinase